MKVQAWADLKDGLEPFGKGFALPRRIDATCTGLPYLVRLEIVLSKQKKLEVEKMTAEKLPRGPSVTSEGIRKLPVAQMVRDAALKRLLQVDGQGKRSARLSPAQLPPAEVVAEGGTSDNALEWIALVYRLAHACGMGPTKAVMDAFDLSRATAGRRVDAARNAGYLGPATERRAGG